MQNTNLQKYLPIGIGALLGLLVLLLISYIFGGGNNSQIKYLGADTQNGNIEQKIETGNLNPKIIEDTSTSINFTPRKLSGGGENWVIALLETQPKTFTGKILYENGLKNSDITLEENNFVLVGEVKSKSSIENIRLELITGECTDEEKNIYEYGLKGTIGNKSINGCGGKAVHVNTSE
jgi:hypothetical protein